MSNEEDKIFIKNIDFQKYFHRIVKIKRFSDVLLSLSRFGKGGFFTEDILDDLNKTGNCFEIAYFMCRDGDGTFDYVEGFFEEHDRKILHGWNYCKITNQYFDLRNEYNGLFSADHELVYHQLIRLNRNIMMDFFKEDKSIPLIKRYGIENMI